MIDNIRIKFPGAAEILKSGLLAERSSSSDNAAFKSGKLLGMKVRTTQRDVFVYGSMTKAIHGNNLSNASAQEIRELIVRLCDTLGLPPSAGHIYRLEFGFSMRMREEPELYLTQLRSAPNHKKSIMRMKGPTGIFFTNSRRYLVLYDKHSAASKTKREYIEGCAQSNLLRYEYRLNGKIAVELGIGGQFNLDCLLRRSVLAVMLNYWRKYFEMIQLAPLLPAYPAAVTGCRTLKELLLVAGVHGHGGIDEYESELEALVRTHRMTSSQRWKHRREIYRLLEKYSSETSSKRIDELREVIQATYAAALEGIESLPDDVPERIAVKPLSERPRLRIEKLEGSSSSG